MTRAYWFLALYKTTGVPSRSPAIDGVGNRDGSAQDRSAVREDHGAAVPREGGREVRSYAQQPDDTNRVHCLLTPGTQGAILEGVLRFAVANSEAVFEHRFRRRGRQLAHLTSYRDHE